MGFRKIGREMDRSVVSSGFSRDGAPGLITGKFGNKSKYELNFNLNPLSDIVDET
jgi:hypothetical protein